MMPPYCPDNAPPGELALFNALATAPGTDAWIVLHSLAIASHVRQVEGEADFVVIVPDHGIVVVEVKSHSVIERLDDGRWKLGNHAPTPRSPFQQASEAMYSVRDYLSARGVALRSIPVLSAVWFTHVRARTMLPSGPEWHDWQILDSEDLRAGALSAILRVLRAGADHLGRKIKGFTNPGIGPDAAGALRIATVLRPRFEAAIVPSDVRRAREAQLVGFVDEQYDALDNMQHNRAVLFTGPAGSGKTWLALEAARREVELGQKGRLLCFNHLLGQRLQRDAADVPGLRAATFHQEALRLSGSSAPPNAGPDFWSLKLPELVLDALLNHGNAETLDFLIVDEIQDLATNPLLDVLDLLVRGGLRGGRVLLFGDFERQAIYESGDGRELIRQRIPDLPSYNLTINCRNMPRIGTVVKKLSHMVPGYRRFRRPDDGVDPVFVTYERATDRSAALVDAVHQLKGDGYKLDEIVVLSPFRRQSTSESTTDPWLRQILQVADGGAPRPGRLRYSTIHAFKGLDAPAVILTDLDDSAIPNFDALLYIGMTRATDRLTVLIEADTLRTAYGGKS
ncbi:NERD domain-containing protein [Mycobacterium sp. HM-7]